MVPRGRQPRNYRGQGPHVSGPRRILSVPSQDFVQLLQLVGVINSSQSHKIRHLTFTSLVPIRQWLTIPTCPVVILTLRLISSIQIRKRQQNNVRKSYNTKKSDSGNGGLMRSSHPYCNLILNCYANQSRCVLYLAPQPIIVLVTQLHGLWKLFVCFLSISVRQLLLNF